MKRIITGIQCTGDIHIGNYFGAMKPIIDMVKSGVYEPYVFIANMHTLNSLHDNNAFQEYEYNGILDFLALGLETDRCVFFRQSDVPEHTELMWLLLCYTPVGMLERAHAYKDKTQNGMSANAGLYTYPILMTADILLYDAHIVPVGEDQRQHIEYARDIAERINTHYNTPLFTLPEPLISKEVGTLKGLDGRKMSKSYKNTIPVFSDYETLSKAIKSIPTASVQLGEPLPTDDCTLLFYYKLFEYPYYDTLLEQYSSGTIGYGDIKKQLAEYIYSYFEEARNKREYYKNNPDRVHSILQNGAMKAHTYAYEKLQYIKKTYGIKPL